MRIVSLTPFVLGALLTLVVPSPAAGFTLKPFGYIKADLAVDIGNPNGISTGTSGESGKGTGFGGNYVRWIDPKPEDRPTTTTLHARQSRLGFDFIADKVGETEVMGRIETDFTNTSAEYAYMLKLRKAFLKVSTPRYELLAGQESDLMSPLVPETVNYLVGWWAGNVGFRRPQIRLTAKNPLGPDKGFDIALAVERAMGTDSTVDNYDVAMPVLAARFGYRSPALSFGLSGHYGKEREYFKAASAEAGPTSEVFDTWSGNLDLSLNLSKSLTFLGEFYYGKNMDAFFGGIGQGIMIPDGETENVAVTSMGGWLDLGFVASEKLKLNLGAAIDLPKEDDLKIGARLSNMSVFANGYYTLVKDVQLALELTYWKTGYKEAEGADELDSDDMRAQLAFIYNFR